MVLVLTVKITTEMAVVMIAIMMIIMISMIIVTFSGFVCNGDHGVFIPMIKMLAIEIMMVLDPMIALIAILLTITKVMVMTVL